MVLWPNRTKRHWRCRRLNRLVDVADRQKRVPGFSQDAAARSRVTTIGAGGIGSQTVEALAQKGYGYVHVCDHDVVSTSDLNRQFFTPRQIGNSKAVSLCENVSKRGFLGTELIAHPYPIQEVDLARIKPDVVFCGVDMQIPDTRLWLCKTLHRLGIPGVFAAVSRDASWGYVLVQEVGKACWACAFKPEFDAKADDNGGNGENRCPGTPAVIDILKTVAGLSLHAIDTLVMPRRLRDWNFRRVSVTRSDFDLALYVEQRPECPVCGRQATASDGEIAQ